MPACARSAGCCAGLCGRTGLGHSQENADQARSQCLGHQAATLAGRLPGILPSAVPAPRLAVNLAGERPDVVSHEPADSRCRTGWRRVLAAPGNCKSDGIEMSEIRGEGRNGCLSRARLASGWLIQPGRAVGGFNKHGSDDQQGTLDPTQLWRTSATGENRYVSGRSAPPMLALQNMSAAGGNSWAPAIGVFRCRVRRRKSPRCSGRYTESCSPAARASSHRARVVARLASRCEEAGNG